MITIGQNMTVVEKVAVLVDSEVEIRFSVVSL